MIKKFEDFVGNNVNEGKKEDSKKQENLKELFREITSMSESLKKNNFEDKRMIVISGYLVCRSLKPPDFEVES